MFWGGAGARATRRCGVVNALRPPVGFDSPPTHKGNNGCFPDVKKGEGPLVVASGLASTRNSLGPSLSPKKEW